MRPNDPASDPAEEAVLDHLDALGADYESVRIDPAYADTAEFCKNYGYSLEDSANCIVVASKDDPPVVAACLNLAPTKLDVNKAVRKHLGVRKLSFAPPDLTEEVTGMQLGGVTPFGLPDEVPLLVDAEVMARERAIVGGGSRALKILVDPEVFERIGEIVEGLATR